MAGLGANSFSQSLLPVFKGQNYHLWSLKMKTMFKSHELWDLVENGYVEPVESDHELRETRKKDATALFLIQSAVADEILPRIAAATTSHQAWGIMKQVYSSTCTFDESHEDSLNRCSDKPDRNLFQADKSISDKRNSGSSGSQGRGRGSFRGTDSKSEDMNTDSNSTDQGTNGQKRNSTAVLENMLSKLLAKLGSDSSSQASEDEDSDSESEDEVPTGDRIKEQYMPLLRATVAGDWETAKRFIQHDSEAVMVGLNIYSDTALDIAIDLGKSHASFVEGLVDFMTAKDLEAQNKIGDTVLSLATMLDNTAAAKILVRKNPNLLYIFNNMNYLPVHVAAQYAHKKTFLYLRKVTNANTEPCPYTGETGFRHLIDVLIAEFYDVAIDLMEKYPELTTMEVEGVPSPLIVMSEKALAFASGTRFRFWERIIYSVLQIKAEKQCSDPNDGDIENVSSHPRTPRIQVYSCMLFQAVYQRLHFMLSQILGFLASHVKDKKLVHYQALEVVKILCEAIRSCNNTGLHDRSTMDAVTRAAISGIPEVIEEILVALPDTLWSNHRERHTFQLAVVNRCDKVFNLIYQLGDNRQNILSRPNKKGNNILHLAGRLAPPHKLNLVSGAALQMQRELQWYKEVEKHVTHTEKLRRNTSDKTPAMVFSEEHKGLVVSGEKWMKDTATSCTIAAALIVTIMFAAAITVPGGVDQQSGIPIFHNRGVFKLFYISNAVSLFTSTTSLLMFLSILTARYAEQDFLFTLPNRLIIGLLTLLVSTATMMVAFSSTMYLLFSQENSWSIMPIVGLACLPVTSFVMLQFPLFVDVITSTYGRGIFGKQSHRRLY